MILAPDLQQTELQSRVWLAVWWSVRLTRDSCCQALTKGKSRVDCRRRHQLVILLPLLALTGGQRSLVAPSAHDLYKFKRKTNIWRSIILRSTTIQSREAVVVSRCETRNGSGGEGLSYINRVHHVYSMFLLSIYPVFGKGILTHLWSLFHRLFYQPLILAPRILQSCHFIISPSSQFHIFCECFPHKGVVF